MADLELILKELRGFHQENREQLESIQDEMVKMNASLDEAEGRIEKVEERIQKNGRSYHGDAKSTYEARGQANGLGESLQM